jgi:hypothetical protein
MADNNDLKTLVNLVILIARVDYDGHFTLLSFTTGFKCAFGTPNLDTGEARSQVRRLRIHKKLENALVDAIINRKSF